MDEDRLTEIALFRYGVILPLLEKGLEPAEARRRRQEILERHHQIPYTGKTRISDRTLRRWLLNYRRDGFAGLKPRPRPTATCRAIPPALLARAVALREENPRRSVRQVIHMLVLAGEAGEGELKPSTLARAFHALDKTRRHLTGPGRAFRRFEKEEPNALWQSDVMHGPYLPDPQNPEKKIKTYLIVFLDDYPRLVTHGQFYREEKLPRLEDCFKKALLKRGLPRQVYVDNGHIYSSRQFRAICAELGIKCTFTSPYSPEAKGKIERFWLTLQTSFLSELGTLEVKDLDELNAYFWAWLEEAYHHQVNRETGQSPATRFAKGPGEIRHADPALIQRVFLWREIRKVDKTARINLQGNTYQVDARLCGHKVELRFDPYDLSAIQVYFQNRRYPDALPFHLAQEHHQGVTPDPVAPPRPHTGLNYLELLKKRYEESQRQKLGRIDFCRLIPREEE